MSYSFGVVAKTKGELCDAAAAKFDEEVVQFQPVHAKDKAAALANLDGALACLPDAVEGRELVASLNGYLSWQGGSENPEFIGASVSVNVAWNVPRPEASQA